MLWSTVFVVLFCLIHFQCDVEGRSYLRWHHPRWHRPRRITSLKWHHTRRTGANLIKVDVADSHHDNHKSLTQLGVKWPNEYLMFKVKGCRDSNVVLKSDSWNYRFCIGGWGNTRTVLEKEMHNGDKETISRKDFTALDCNHYKDFWISWNKGKIEAGQGNILYTDVFLLHKENAPFHVLDIEIFVEWNAKNTYLFNVTGKSCDIHLGWMEYNHHCYLLSFFTSTWDEAESYCKNHNSHLVRIETAKENDWITTKISKLNHGDHAVWTGGNDINEEGTWKWTSGSPCFTYTNWSYKEPNGGRNENCLNIIHEKGSSRNGKWNDLSCRRKLYFMCEKKK